MSMERLQKEPAKQMEAGLYRQDRIGMEKALDAFIKAGEARVEAIKDAQGNLISLKVFKKGALGKWKDGELMYFADLELLKQTKAESLPRTEDYFLG